MPLENQEAANPQIGVFFNISNQKHLSTSSDYQLKENKEY